MAWIHDFIQINFWNNSGQAYLIALGIFVGLFVAFLIFEKYIIGFLKKKSKQTKIKWDDIVIDFMSAIHWQFYLFVSFYVASLYLVLPELVSKALKILLIIFIAYYIAQGFSRVVDYFTSLQLEKRKEKDDSKNTSMLKVFGILFKVAIYSIILLMVLSNLGIQITPLIASLGVGGIALAIALQSVLGDLFAAFAIYFDKPFKEGDFIIIGDDMGTVESIGIKTTRINALQGFELVVPNSDLTNTRIDNYKQMKERRISTTIGVEYSTSSNKLKKINSIIKKAVESTKNAKFDRTHFKGFGNFSLDFEFVYYVTSPDYAQYMDVQQEINFKIREAFEKEKIVFAFPTQTIHVDSFKNNSSSSKKK